MNKAEQHWNSNPYDRKSKTSAVIHLEGNGRRMFSFHLLRCYKCTIKKHQLLFETFHVLLFFQDSFLTHGSFGNIKHINLVGRTNHVTEANLRWKCRRNRLSHTDTLNKYSNTFRTSTQLVTSIRMALQMPNVQTFPHTRLESSLLRLTSSKKGNLHQSAFLYRGKEHKTQRAGTNQHLLWTVVYGQTQSFGEEQLNSIFNLWATVLGAPWAKALWNLFRSHD